MKILPEILSSWLLPSLACLTTLALSASAAPVSVPNFSFEDPDVADGQYIASFPGWSVGGNGFNQFGTGDFDDVSYPGSRGDNGRLPGTSHGGQAVALGIQSSASLASLTSGPLGVVADGVSYTLTVAIGNPLNFPHPDVSAIQLLVDDMVVASRSAGPELIPDGNFTDFSVSFATASNADPSSGGALSIRFQASGDPSAPGIGDWQAHFDNVRLEVTAVPEPSVVGLVLAGVVGVGATQVRRTRQARGQFRRDPLAPNLRVANREGRMGNDQEPVP